MTTKVLGLQLRYLRPALVAIIVLDVLAIAVFAFRLETTTRTTTTPLAQPVSVAPTVQPTTVPVPTTQLVPQPPVPVVLTPGSTATSSPSSTPTSTATPTQPGDGPSTGAAAPGIARCLIPIKKPTSSGGLQSLIGFAPAFGPFKAEAFAAASAYQPVLQLLGPILAKYPEIAPKIEPAMTPFIAAFANLLDQGFNVIAPYYAPHRDQVLEAESKLAAALAPYAQKLVSSPLGGCIVEVQAALLEDTASTTKASAAKKD